MIVSSIMNDRFFAASRDKLSSVLSRAVALSLLLCFTAALSQDRHLYLTANTMAARPLAMGGAYVAVEDALTAGLYNPANAGGYRLDTRTGFQFFLNPWSSALAVSQGATFFEGENPKAPRAFATLGLLLKGFNLHVGPFDVSAILNEQASSSSMLPEGFDQADNYWNNRYNVLALRIRLADRVSVGGSLGLFYLKPSAAAQRSWQVLASYGIALAPSHSVLLGVSYLTVPARAAGNQRDHPERIADSSINLGMSYQPFAGTTFSLDVRNVVEDAGRMVRREPHLGIEQSLFSLMSLRLGGFYKSEEEQAALSCGLGLLDLNWPRKRATHEQFAHWAVNYGLVGERIGMKRRRFIHALTVSVRL